MSDDQTNPAIPYPDNRAQQLTPATTATDARTASISPTGTPWFTPSKLMPIAGALVVVASGLLALFPAGSVGFIVCTVVIGVGAAFGIVSPGARKKDGVQ